MTRDEYMNGGARMTAKRGTDLPHARLNPAKVRAIRADSRPARTIAYEMGVHYRTVEKVRQYDTWRHV